MTEVSEIQQTLYDKLGGSKGIKNLIEDIVEAHMRNPVIKARFLPYRDDSDNLKQIKKHLCDFLGAGCGGPELYGGRDMPTAHRGMNIRAEEYMAAVDDILKTMEEHNIDAGTRKEILFTLYSLKEQVMHA